MEKIDGFAIHCGFENRVITLSNGIYNIGCFEGTKEEAIKAIDEEYSGEGRDAYLKKLDDCENMQWLTEEVHKQLKNDKNWVVRKAVARYSDKYHYQLKDDCIWNVRAAVAECSDKYHGELKDDEDFMVRAAVARYSDKYHEQLKDDEDWIVRIEVAYYSDKYHDQLKDDPHRFVREAVEEIRNQKL